MKVWYRLFLAASANIKHENIFTFFGLALIIGFWVSFASYLSMVGNEKKNQAITQVENTAIAISQSVANNVGQIDFLLKLLAESNLHKNVANMPLYDMRHIFTLRDDMYHVSFTDAVGNVRNNTAFQNGARNVNIRDRDHFKGHKERNSRSLFISKPLTGRGTSKYTLQFSRGIYGPGGDFEGAAVVGVSPTAFLSNLDDLKLGAASGIVLIGTDDIVRASTGTFQEAIGSGFKDYTLIQTLRRGEVDVDERERRGEAQVFAMRQVPGYDLRIVIVTDLKDGDIFQVKQVGLMSVGGLVVTLFIGVLIVVGRRKIKFEQLEIALQEQISANEIQRNFISMASHEFRTPLAIIDSSAQKLRSRAGSLKADDIIGRTKTIRGAVKRMTDLMESILALAKVNGGGLELKRTNFSLGEMVEAVVARASELDSRRTFLLDVAELPSDIEADRLLLEQVLTNLLSNAVKYSPPSEPISIVCRVEGAWAEIVVSDRGIGIDDAEIGKLFSRYFRAKTAEGIPGTGIGLYFVKLIVEEHRGTIGVSSRLGVGTTFTVRLPMAGVQVGPLLRAAA